MHSDEHHVPLFGKNEKGRSGKTCAWISFEAFVCEKFPKKEKLILFCFNRLSKKWLPQQLRKLSHSKGDKLTVDKSALKKGSDKKSKVRLVVKHFWTFHEK